MKSNFTPGKASLFTWACVMIVTLAWTASAITESSWLRSNVFELLPEGDYDPLREKATRIVEKELGAQLLFMIGDVDKDVAKSSADSFSARLGKHELIGSVTARIDQSQIATIGQFYFPYRRQLLSDEQLADVTKNADDVVRNAMAVMYSPLGAGRGDSLLVDPFFLLPESLRALQPSTGSMKLDDAYLIAERDGLNYVFVMARMTKPSLSIDEQEALATQLEQVTADLEILKTGFFFYAHAGTQSAKGEISVIGAGSLLGLILLVLMTFRSLRPLALIVLTVASGCLLALAITVGVFGYVHLFTLVFGASLIGVSVDYSFHYAAEDAFGGRDWTPKLGLQRIFMGITLGLLTSVLAYLALTVAPFPGLQQLAVFSTAGLTGAYLTLLCCCTLWRRRLSVDDRSIILNAAGKYLALWERTGSRNRYILVGALALAVLTGYRMLDTNDDISVLQSQPDALKQEEAAIREILGVDPGSTFLLASSSSDEELLRLEESLRIKLDDMIAEGTLGSYQAVSRWVPSRARQARSYTVYTELINSRVPDFFRTLGVAEEQTADVIADLTNGMKPLQVKDWLTHPASERFRNLWLGAKNESASIILINGLQDSKALDDALADFPSVDVVNKGRELSELFGRYRLRVGWVLAGAYAFILFGLSFRYGVRRAAVLLIPPVFAGTLALTIISALGNSLNIFNFLALILVLGIGIDFTLFLAEARGELRTTMFAITLSALTTMLAFGLLALSSTYAVHSFGITVLIGIAIAYLLSPLVTPESRTK